MAEQTKGDSFFGIATSNLPLISVVLLAVSFFNHYLFYSIFSIPIYNYIQVTELITLFIPVFISYCIDAISAVLVFVLIGKFLSFTYPAKTYKEKVYRKEGVKVEDGLGIIFVSKRIRALRKVYIKRAFRQGQHLKGIGYFLILLILYVGNATSYGFFLIGPGFIFCLMMK